MSAPATPPAPASAPRERLLALDVFRGLTIAAMLLVNNPGSRDAVYPPLRHAEWHGWTPTDLIFPFFLFIVGITTQLSLTARAAAGASDATLRRQILRRGALIFAVGLLINWIPFYQAGTIAGHAHPAFVDRVAARLHGLRVLGVLQRIGLAYVAAALLTWRAPVRRVVIAVAAILLSYWLAMTLLPVPHEGALGAALLDDPARTLAAWTDRAVLDWSRWGLGNHLRDAGAFDPEGVLSTLPAVATAMLGVLAGRWIGGPAPLAARINGLFAAGALAIVAGLLWGWAFPVNKNLWTSSYVLFTAGAAGVALATVLWLVDVRGWRGWTRPAVIYGTNPLVAFAGSEVLATVLHSTIKVKVEGGRIGLTEWLYRAFDTVLAPRDASLAYALCFVAAWYGILLVLHRRRIFVRI